MTNTEAMIMADREELKDKSGNRYFLIKMNSPEHLMCWRSASGSGEVKLYMGLLDVGDVPKEELERLELWNKISAKKRKAILSEMEQKEKEKKERIEKMHKARRGRKSKYPNIAKTLTCCECGEVKNVVPSQVANLCEKNNVMYADYVKTYKCRRCKKNG